MAHAWITQAHLGDRPCLVVAANEMDAVGPAEFEACEERDRLDGKEAAVDVVACER
jgi:hypothetical protein